MYWINFVIVSELFSKTHGVSSDDPGAIDTDDELNGWSRNKIGFDMIVGMARLSSWWLRRRLWQEMMAQRVGLNEPREQICEIGKFIWKVGIEVVELDQSEKVGCEIGVRGLDNLGFEILKKWDLFFGEYLCFCLWVKLESENSTISTVKSELYCESLEQELLAVGECEAHFWS